jgi:hypothetical protein
MRKAVVTGLSVLLIAGSAVQMATTSARQAYRAPAVASEQFRNANSSIEGRASTWCSTEPGNPYNPETDYMAWSAFRASGEWDSRNDCK